MGSELNIKDVFAEWRVGASVFTLIPGRGWLTSWDIDLPKGVRRVLYDGGMRGCGGSQILFPFVGQSVVDGKRLDSWKGRGGKILGMPYNGFAQEAGYRIVSRDESSITLELVPTVEMERCYPFEYSFRVQYRFFELGVEVMLELENRDEVSIPWCGGVGFDLEVPWHEGLSLGSYQVCIPAKKAYYQESSGKIVTDKEFMEITSLDDPCLGNRIYTKLKSNMVSVGPKGGEENITIKIGRDIVSGFSTAVRVRKNLEDLGCRIEISMGLSKTQGGQNGQCAVLPGDRESFIVFLNLL